MVRAMVKPAECQNSILDTPNPEAEERAWLEGEEDIEQWRNRRRKRKRGRSRFLQGEGASATSAGQN